MQCAHCQQKVIYAKNRLCKEHFLNFYHKKVDHVLRQVALEGKKILVGVSGGKDSASTAHALLNAGCSIELLYLDLGITHYSDESREAASHLAEILGVPLHILNFKKEHFTITEANKLIQCGKIEGAICGTCGLSKRFFLNKFAFENGFDYIATGHCLDDELAFIMINLKNQDLLQLARVGPTVRGDLVNKLVGKVKPLYYLTEKENRLYAVLNRLPIHAGECSYATNNTQIAMKEMFNIFEEKFPHFKHNITRSIRKLIAESVKVEKAVLTSCSVCGYATTKERSECLFCCTKRRIGMTLLEPKP